jgi:murein endopeptidase
MGLVLAGGCASPNTALRSINAVEMGSPGTEGRIQPGARAIRQGATCVRLEGARGVGVLHVRGRDGAWESRCFRKTSRSVGRPNRGRLEGGESLPREGPGWVQKGVNATGTNEAIALLVASLEDVRGRFAGTVPVYIGDLSQDGGGRLSPHKSHQSGRDIDIGYYARANQGLKRFETMTAETLDAAKTWHLVERLLLTGQVQYIFMSYRIQEVLYLTALDSGWGERDLLGLFQYPRGHQAKRGVIRHAKGHQNHFHIRFRCPSGDAECVP